MRIPVATYRLQINDDFTLEDARRVTPHLAHLGITDLYLSPIFEARHGSTHGYDVTDPTRVRASVGGIDALRGLAAEAKQHHMGILLDIVPNHMAASMENPWWRDVLQYGPASRHAAFFDIDWRSADAPGRIRLPILADTLDNVLDRDEIRIDTGTDTLTYQQTSLPLAPGSITSDVRSTLERQHYDLVPWWTSAEEMTYRRFFDISELAGVRVEDDDVFEVTHALVRDLAREGIITGLRVDHIDGLRDPAAYLQQLRRHVRDPDGEPVFTVVEKILARSETLPHAWECEGTTGYEFLNLATGLLIEPHGHARIESFYRRISGDSRDFAKLVREKKLHVMERLFGGELKSLADRFAQLTGTDYAIARRAIAEVTSGIDVYRTYTHEIRVGARDRRHIDDAANEAIQRTEAPGLQRAIEAVRRVLLLDDSSPPTEQLDWVLRWQQFTGPVTAKGIEDTALYCHNALLAVNDIGSDPARPCMDARELVAALQRRQATSALSLSATATHDTKRGEDTRARIAVLSELPDEWRNRLRRWIREGDEWKAELVEEEETVAPSADVESLLYQTLLGAWPLAGANGPFRDRMKAYMTKAVREAKEQTSWRRPDEDYEQALSVFIERLMAELGRQGLAEEVESFAARLAPHGALNAIAQMLLKVTAPGIPDFYQGTELWSFTLVDPDNRVTIDFAEARRLFDSVTHLRDVPDGAAARALLEAWPDGRIKLLLTAIALRFRATHRDVFEQGDVVELAATGPKADHVFAFARRLDDRVCVTVLPRWTVGLGEAAALAPDVWADTSVLLPPALRIAWHNAFTGETTAADPALRLDSLLRSLPFALLEVSKPVGA